MAKTSKEKLTQYIENIEQLGADSRYYNDMEMYFRITAQLDGILYWAKRAKKEVEKLEAEAQKSIADKK